LEQFLTRWIGKLTAIVAGDYPPAYRFDLNGYGPLLGRLSKERPIPGMNGRTGLLPAQKHAAAAVLTRLQTERDALTVGEMGSGKAQPLTCRVLTPAGWKRMGDIQVDDEVINPEGGTARVAGVYPQGVKQIFRVTYSDGAQTECCDEHLWLANTPLRKWRGFHPQVFQLREMRDRLFTTSGNARYFIPIIRPMEFEPRPLPLEPYLLGALIGDGGLTGLKVAISSMDDEILQAVVDALPFGVSLKFQAGYTYRITRDRQDTGAWFVPSNPVVDAMRELGLLGRRAEAKFIPEQYLFAGVAERIALLQGLLDTDGTVGRHTGCITFTSVSEQLAKDVVALVQSLGGVARTNSRVPKYTHNGERRHGRLAYYVTIRLANEIQPFRLPRKLERVIPRTKYGINRALVNVEYVGEKEAQCIALDSENGLYVTDDYIVTHNTTIGVAVAAGREASRTIVLCPPHLVDKWRREIKAVWPRAATMHLKTPGDVDRFFAARSDGRPVVGVLKQTTARSASGWEHAYDYGGPAGHNYGAGGYSDVRRPWGSVVSAAKLPQAEDGWRLSERQMASLQMQGVRCPVCGAQQFSNGAPLAAQELKSARRFCDNPRCGSPLFQFTRRRSESQERGSFKLYAGRERLLRGYLQQRGEIPERELNRWSGTAVRDTFGYARVPLAGYIKRRARGQLDLVIVDEVHQYKGIDSDQGYAMHHLAQAAEKVVGLTGTVYGGKASSIFHLLYRLSPEMTGAYTDNQASGRRRIRHRDWVSAYGILQRIETKKLDEDGRQTANSRSNIRYKELPGGSPAMLPWLLNRSVFLSLGDMGFPLPDYSEIPVVVPMATEQALLYESLKADLKAELVERLVRGDRSLLAGYLHALLFWPDSPRRAKVVRCPRTSRVVASVPGLPEAFRGPKEEAIVDLILEEKAQGRRVLLLCLQTDTLDIQPEWKSMLAEAGLKAAILRAAPNKREGWVEKQVAAGVDVVITHPKKVETGIDLLDFPTIVWMSPHYSVYTVLQASRRSWRIGQTRPVKVYYFAYGDTIQTDALYLVAAKVAAALRVNGDTVADDSLAELDEITGNDIVATLARIVTGETQLEAGLTAKNLQQAFAEANASIRQANTMIGEYEVLDDAVEAASDDEVPAEIVTMPEPAPEHVSQQPLLSGAGDRPFRAGADETFDASEVGRLPFPSQSGLTHSAGPDGKSNGAGPGVPIGHPKAKKEEDGRVKEPPVPRPRVLLHQLRPR
ncbi:MAG: hypothetical protein GX579_10635, partial [Chloroflexi bacterium]|nr:hypothetical protein [Chloroflexota bacterium]